jgi:4-amino-4-deoxychorismate lyase
LEQHLRRLTEGCERLRLPQPPLDKIRDEANTLIQGKDKAVLKIIITRGQGGRGYRTAANTSCNRILIRYPFPAYPPERYRQGVKVHLCANRLSVNPQLAGIKHLNRLEHVLAANEWQDDTIVEGLMQDHLGNIIEGTMSNVFLFANERLITPDLTNCGIAGIMRQQVLESAQDLGICHDIREVRKPQLLDAGEVFLTNSLIGIWPVTKIERRDYDVGPMTRRLMQELDRREV